MNRLAHFILIASIAACGGADSGSDGSGLESTKKLRELSPGERQQLCDYMVEAEGGVHTEMCGDGLDVRVQSAAECVTNFGKLSATCSATVDNAEACAAAVGANLCDSLSAPACSFLFQCQ